MRWPRTSTGVPIVPVVSCGGQSTYLPLTDGRRLVEVLGLNKLGRLKVLPISLAVQWGLNIGDMAGHVPLPVKILQEVLAPIDVIERFGAKKADSDEAYEYVTSLMQETLTRLAAERASRP